MKEINEIRSQIGQLKAKLREAEERLEDAGLRHMGLQIGDLIEVDGKGIVSVTGCHKSILHGVNLKPDGVKVKKDGTAGQQSAGYIGLAWRKL